MPSREPIPEEQNHLPARSGTPAAWLAVGFLGLLVMGWMFWEPLCCGALRLGLSASAWTQGHRVQIGSISFSAGGRILAKELDWSSGSKEHGSHGTCEWLEIKPRLPWRIPGIMSKESRGLIRELRIGKTKLLIDHRAGTEEKLTVSPSTSGTAAWASLIPLACYGGPVDLVDIGENYRVAVNALSLQLPNQWPGTVSHAEALLDIGSWHHAFPADKTTAILEGTALNISGLDLGKGVKVEELALNLKSGRLEFGWRGTVSGGHLRGDGALGNNHLEVTMVGENLPMESLTALIVEDQKPASGIIRQARMAFRGDLDHPMEADVSLRLVADAFRWKGLGWETLRLASTLTGRTLTLTELKMRQKENELDAEGQSKLPVNWRAALRAPFTAVFHASLEDAGALAALAGPQFAQLAGGLTVEGSIKGADNLAEGYCNLVGNGMKIRDLQVDWLKGCLLFDGGKTRLADLEAASGSDSVVLEGVVENSSPHAYKAAAQIQVRNLTKKLAQLGITTVSAIGGGDIKGTWQGEGSSKGHVGSFQAKITEWVSPATRGGMTGDFEGSYAPGFFQLSDAELRQADLRLAFRLFASSRKLDVWSITAIRNGKRDPLLEGELALPLNAPELWKTGSVVPALFAGEKLDLRLAIHGLKVEELADLLGQQSRCTGMLEGAVRMGGTVETPEVHASLTASGFSPWKGLDKSNLSLRVDSSAGRASLQVDQEPSGDSPLSVKADFPFRWQIDGGVLHPADGSPVVKGSGTFRHLALDGWARLIGGGCWPLRGSSLDGSLTLGGTMAKPVLEGSLLLEAGELLLPAAESLGELRLPVAFTGTKSTLRDGAARYHGTPVVLTGSLDWGHPSWESEWKLSGEGIALPLLDQVSGLENQGDASIVLRATGGEMPSLGGEILIKSVRGHLQNTLTPYFAPPGISGNDPVPVAKTTSGDDGDIWKPLSLDLRIRTKGELTMVPLQGIGQSSSYLRSWKPSPDPGIIQAECQLTGIAENPITTGSITAKQQTVILPSGKFLVPEAHLKLDKENGCTLEAMGFGMTGAGLCVLGVTGHANHPVLCPEGPPGTTAPDMLMALASPRLAGSPGLRLRQAAAWIRQGMLLPVPVAAWRSGQVGGNDPASLGFYGLPWTGILEHGELVQTSVPPY